MSVLGHDCQKCGAYTVLEFDWCAICDPLGKTKNDARSDGLGDWHTQPPGWKWRVRDRFARFLGFHCWDCMVRG
jgi:hypothetical protein